MKNISKKASFVIVSILSIICVFAFTYNAPDEWEVPEEYENMVNPVEADEESLDIGAELYVKHCKSCHGKYGEGDGTKASELDTDCGDFSLEEFHAQSDGSLFYKTKIGRDDMPEYSKKIPDDEDIWHLVNYMRTFGDQ